MILHDGTCREKNTVVLGSTVTEIVSKLSKTIFKCVSEYRSGR